MCFSLNKQFKLIQILIYKLLLKSIIKTIGINEKKLIGGYRSIFALF